MWRSPGNFWTARPSRRAGTRPVFFWNARDLERKLADFQAYYNAARSRDPRRRRPCAPDELKEDARFEDPGVVGEQAEDGPHEEALQVVTVTRRSPWRADTR